jgi:hypothetical protein
VPAAHGAVYKGMKHAGGNSVLNPLPYPVQARSALPGLDGGRAGTADRKASARKGRSADGSGDSGRDRLGTGQDVERCNHSGGTPAVGAQRQEALSDLSGRTVWFKVIDGHMVEV